MPRTPPSTETDSPVGICQGCGQKVLFAMTDGARIVLDEKVPTYLTRVNEQQDGFPVVDRSRSIALHRCPVRDVNKFSGKNTPQKGPSEASDSVEGDDNA